MPTLLPPPWDTRYITEPCAGTVAEMEPLVLVTTCDQRLFSLYEDAEGRPAVDAVSLGGLADVPGLIVLGHYGAQRWQAGVLSQPPVPPGVQAVREALPGLLAELAAPEGTTVEDKGTALAVHTRKTADPAAALALLREPLGRLADRAALALEPGRLVLELRPRGTDKGTALRELARERAARSALFCGDDLGDLTAFAAIRQLRAEGIPGCAVASESAETPQVAEAADVVVDGPPGIVRFLSALADSLLAAPCSLRGGVTAGRGQARSSRRPARRRRRACSGRR